MNLETTRLRGRPSSRWQDEVREDGSLVGRKGCNERLYNREEWKKLLRTVRNRRILHMPMELITIKWTQYTLQRASKLNVILSLLLHRASCRFTIHHTTNKCTNCMSFILNHFFKTLFTAPTCFDSISLIIIR